MAFPTEVAVGSVAHAMIGDYVPFILFVGALFIVAGGIHIRSSFVGRPIVNAGILFVGAFVANLMGTTGAAMLLIRPLLAANEGRRYKMHTFVFFIFIVANIGRLSDAPGRSAFVPGLPARRDVLLDGAASDPAAFGDARDSAYDLSRH